MFSINTNTTTKLPMRLQTVLEQTSTQNQAMEYVDKVARLLTKNPSEIVKSKKSTREKIAQILTGLYVLTNPNFRKSLGVSDTDYQRITAQLHSNKAAAFHAITAGKRMPSVLATNKQNIDNFDKLPPAKQQAFIATLKQLYTSLSKKDTSTTTQPSSSA